MSAPWLLPDDASGGGEQTCDQDVDDREDVLSLGVRSRQYRGRKKAAVSDRIVTCMPSPIALLCEDFFLPDLLDHHQHFAFSSRRAIQLH